MLRNPNQHGASQRRASFSSTVVMAGYMPDRIKLGDPTINVITTYENPPKVDDIISSVETLFQYHRLSTVPTGKKASLDWKFESVGSIDPKRMIRVLNISCDTKEEWAEVVHEQRNTSLRTRNLPWWEFVLMINEGKGDHVLLFRIDHALGDGLSVGKALTSIIKGVDGSEIQNMIPASMISNKQTKSNTSFMGRLSMLLRAIWDVSMAPIGKVDDPIHFSKNVTGPDHVDNLQRKIMIFDPIPIDFVKKLKDKAGVSLNDVLLTAWSHAVHQYCHHQKCPELKQKGSNILHRTLMTYGFPNGTTSPAQALQNGWVPLSLRLPIGLNGIMAKLRHINRETQYLKLSPIAHVQQMLQNVILPFLPCFLYRDIVHRVYYRHSTTVTNVPGPKERIMIAKEQVKSCMFFVTHIQPVLSMLSYDGHINITLAVDEIAIPDSHLLQSYYMKAFVMLGNELTIDTPASILQSTKMST